MIDDLQYHLRRARSERDSAGRSADARVAAAHRELSQLHVDRALLIRAVRRIPVENVIPLRRRALLGIRAPQAGKLPVAAERS